MAIIDYPPGDIGVACAQLAPVFGDLKVNLARAAEAIIGASDAGADLVVLPELCTTGYAFEDESQARELGEPADGPTVAAWRALAADHRIVIIGGLCELDGRGAPRNSVAVVQPDGRWQAYRKTHLWDHEQLIFRAGEEPPPVVETSVGRVGLAVCYDAFFPEVMRALTLAGADLIAVPMNSPATDPPDGAGDALTAPLALEVMLAVAAATVNRVFVAQADRTGRERGIDWAEASAICDPDGRLLAGPVSGASVLTARCDLARARDKRLGRRNDVLADRRPELYRERLNTIRAKETVH